jgi:hypothetical protein
MPGRTLLRPVCLLAVPQDFLEMLPVPFYTLPGLGMAPLNLASALVKDDNPTDLGPKTYIAYGRLEEGTEGKEGDSVTKLHLDMTDAVNICLHAQYAPGEQVVVRCGDAEADKPRWVCGWVGCESVKVQGCHRLWMSSYGVWLSPGDEGAKGMRWAMKGDTTALSDVMFAASRQST